MELDLDVIILAGGKSRRMGSDKAGIELGGKSLLKHAMDNARSWGAKRILVAGPPRPWLQAEYISDPPGYEPSSLLGFYAGFLASGSPWSLVIGCDMPFLSREVVELLWTAKNQGGAVAQWQNRLQPMPGLYPRRAAQEAQDLLANKRFHLAALLDRLDPAVVPEAAILNLDPGGYSFYNVNSREELAAAETIIATI